MRKRVSTSAETRRARGDGEDESASEADTNATGTGRGDTIRSPASIRHDESIDGEGGCESVTEAVGLRIDIAVSDPNCPIHDATSNGDVPAGAIDRSATQNGDRLTEEFRIPEADADGVLEEMPSDIPVETFRYADQRVYRFARAADRPCFCAAVEGFDRPLTNIHIADGYLYGSFLALESEDIHSMIRSLHDEFDVSVRRIVHADGEHSENLVVLDRGVLTDRQLEALRTAHELGYFDIPKGANGGEVAAELGVSRSTFLAHLNKAQDKLLDTVLADDLQTKAT